MDEKEDDMYTSRNFKTKKEFKNAVANGERITLFAPGLGEPKFNGVDFVEGPQFVPHTWYAEVEMKNGTVVKVK